MNSFVIFPTCATVGIYSLIQQSISVHLRSYTVGWNKYPYIVKFFITIITCSIKWPLRWDLFFFSKFRVLCSKFLYVIFSLSVKNLKTIVEISKAQDLDHFIKYFQPSTVAIISIDSKKTKKSYKNLCTKSKYIYMIAEALYIHQFEPKINAQFCHGTLNLF